jgi:hypothetical protein
VDWLEIAVFMPSLWPVAYSTFVNSIHESSLITGKLDPLPVFTSFAAAERFIDKVATKLGLPVRMESYWTLTPRRRYLRYGDLRNMELIVLISPGRILEGKPTFHLSGTAIRTDQPRSVQIQQRLRPMAFQKDLSESLGRLRTSLFPSKPSYFRRFRGLKNQQTCALQRKRSFFHVSSLFIRGALIVRDQARYQHKMYKLMPSLCLRSHTPSDETVSRDAKGGGDRWLLSCPYTSSSYLE